jgi:hypothetical protein
MQRKVVVEIKTVDDRHCSKRCPLLRYSEQLDDHYCAVFCGSLLDKDTIGYIRTAECIKGER